MVCIKGSIDAGGFLEPFRIADEHQRLKLFELVQIFFWIHSSDASMTVSR